MNSESSEDEKSGVVVRTGKAERVTRRVVWSDWRSQQQEQQQKPSSACSTSSSSSSATVSAELSNTTLLQSSPAILPAHPLTPILEEEPKINIISESQKYTNDHLGDLFPFSYSLIPPINHSACYPCAFHSETSPSIDISSSAQALFYTVPTSKVSPKKQIATEILGNPSILKSFRKLEEPTRLASTSRVRPNRQWLSYSHTSRPVQPRRTSTPNSEATTAAVSFSSTSLRASVHSRPASRNSENTNTSRSASRQSSVSELSAVQQELSITSPRMPLRVRMRRDEYYYTETCTKATQTDEMELKDQSGASTDTNKDSFRTTSGRRLVKVDTVDRSTSPIQNQGTSSGHYLQKLEDLEKITGHFVIQRFFTRSENEFTAWLEQQLASKAGQEVEGQTSSSSDSKILEEKETEIVTSEPAPEQIKDTTEVTPVTEHTVTSSVGVTTGDTDVVITTTAAPVTPRITDVQRPAEIDRIDQVLVEIESQVILSSHIEQVVQEDKTTVLDGDVLESKPETETNGTAKEAVSEVKEKLETVVENAKDEAAEQAATATEEKPSLATGVSTDNPVSPEPEQPKAEAEIEEKIEESKPKESTPPASGPPEDTKATAEANTQTTESKPTPEVSPVTEDATKAQETQPESAQAEPSVSSKSSTDKRVAPEKEIPQTPEPKSETPVPLEPVDAKDSQPSETKPEESKARLKRANTFSLDEPASGKEPPSKSPTPPKSTESADGITAKPESRPAFVAPTPTPPPTPKPADTEPPKSTESTDGITAKPESRPASVTATPTPPPTPKPVDKEPPKSKPASPKDSKPQIKAVMTTKEVTVILERPPTATKSRKSSASSSSRKCLVTDLIPCECFSQHFQQEESIAKLLIALSPRTSTPITPTSPASAQPSIKLDPIEYFEKFEAILKPQKKAPEHRAIKHSESFSFGPVETTVMNAESHCQDFPPFVFPHPGVHRIRKSTSIDSCLGTESIKTTDSRLMEPGEEKIMDNLNVSQDSHSQTLEDYKASMEDEIISKDSALDGAMNSGRSTIWYTSTDRISIRQDDEREPVEPKQARPSSDRKAKEIFSAESDTESDIIISENYHARSEAESDTEATTDGDAMADNLGGNDRDDRRRRRDDEDDTDDDEIDGKNELMARMELDELRLEIEKPVGMTIRNTCTQTNRSLVSSAWSDVTTSSSTTTNGSESSCIDLEVVSKKFCSVPSAEGNRRHYLPSSSSSLNFVNCNMNFSMKADESKFKMSVSLPGIKNRPGMRAAHGGGVGKKYQVAKTVNQKEQDDRDLPSLWAHVRNRLDSKVSVDLPPPAAGNNSPIQAENIPAPSKQLVSNRETLGRLGRNKQHKSDRPQHHPHHEHFLRTHNTTDDRIKRSLERLSKLLDIEK